MQFVPEPGRLRDARSRRTPRPPNLMQQSPADRLPGRVYLALAALTFAMSAYVLATRPLASVLFVLGGVATLLGSMAFGEARPFRGTLLALLGGLLLMAGLLTGIFGLPGILSIL